MNVNKRVRVQQLASFALPRGYGSPADAVVFKPFPPGCERISEVIARWARMKFP